LQEQLKITGEERNEYQDQVESVLPLAGTGGSNDGEKEHKSSEIPQISGTNRRAL
jgi:hypothetical protein